MTDLTAGAHDDASQANLVSGIQNNHFGVRPAAETIVSIVPPVRPDQPLRGRDDLIASLLDAWTDGAPRVRVVHGLGGCGKTSVAAELAARTAETDVWWLSAADPEQFHGGLRTLARTLGLTGDNLRASDFADRLWTRLNDHPKRWLLIIDNADDASILSIGGRPLGFGTSWLRPVRSPGGLAVVTSRDGDAETWGDWCRLHRLDVLPTEEGAAVLLDLAPTGCGDTAAAGALSDRLGGLPLALRLAGAYLSRTSKSGRFAPRTSIQTFDAYRAALDDGTAPLAFPDDPSHDLAQREPGAPLAQTWDLTLDLLASRGLPQTRPLLSLLSCFADAPLPYEHLLTLDALYETPPFDTLTGESLWAGLNGLATFDLIQMTPPTESPLPLLSLHPLIRDVGRATAPDHFPSLVHTLLTAATAAAPDPTFPTSWPFWDAFSPHIDAWLRTTVDSPSINAALRVLRYLQDSGQHRLEEERGRAHLPLITGSLGSDHPMTLNTHLLIAHSMAGQGRHADAEPEYQRIHTAHLHAQGPDHPDTLRAHHGIAYSMALQGRYAEAETEYRKILTASLRILGPDHPDTLNIRNEIAVAMVGQGHYTAAEAEHRQILADRLRILGPDHPKTLVTRHDIATATARQGRYRDAEAEYRQILTDRLRILGPDHPRAITTRHNLAHTLAQQGRYQDAEAEYRQVLTDRLRIQGPDHPDTLNTRHNLAHTLAQQGQHQDAATEYREILADRLRILGPEHPDTLNTHHEIARMMHLRGEREQARTEFRAVHEIRVRVQGADHPSTKATRSWLE